MRRGQGYGGGMPRRTGEVGSPVSYVPEGAWPDGELDGSEPAAYAQHVARRLRDAIGDRSLRSVAEEAGLQHTTVSDVLNGRTWPDMLTLVRLEQALDVKLWPDGLAGGE